MCICTSRGLWGSSFCVCCLFPGPMCMPCYVRSAFTVHGQLASVQHTCCVGSVCTVSSQGCVSFGLGVFLTFCVHRVSCVLHAHCQCHGVCVPCALRAKCALPLRCMFHHTAYSGTEHRRPALFGRCRFAVPGFVTCMTTSVMGECDLRPQGLPIMPQPPQLPPPLHSLGCKPRVPPQPSWRFTNWSRSHNLASVSHRPAFSLLTVSQSNCFSS